MNNYDNDKENLLLFDVMHICCYKKFIFLCIYSYAQ